MQEMRSQRAYFVITCDHVSKTNVGNRPDGCNKILVWWFQMSPTGRARINAPARDENLADEAFHQKLHLLPFQLNVGDPLLCGSELLLLLFVYHSVHSVHR